MIELLWPWAFALLTLPLAIRYATKPLKSQDAALSVPQVESFDFAQTSSRSRHGFKHVALMLIALFGWIALSTALARPQLAGEPTVLPTTSRDLMLVIDISGSMGQEDMIVNGRPYTRLAVTKYAVQNFLNDRSGDRVGVVLFGSLPYVYIPLTPDVRTVGQMLQDAPIGIAGRSTAIGDSIGLAIKQLLKHPVDHRVVVLLTDGSNNAGELDPNDAAELALKSQVRVYTIAVTPDSRSSIFGDFFSRNAEMDTELLQDIAKRTGGKFFRAKDLTGLSAIYEEIDQLEPIEQGGTTVRPVKALFYYPLAIAIFLFGLIWLLKSKLNV